MLLSGTPLLSKRVIALTAEVPDKEHVCILDYTFERIFRCLVVSNL